MFGQSFASAPIGSSIPTESGNCGSLGKTYSCAQVEDIIRKETGTEYDDSITSQMFLDWINWACDSLKEKLGLWKRYVCWKNLGVGTTLDLSSVPMRGILKIVDSSAGIVKMISPFEQDRVSSFSAYDSSVLGVQLGESLVLTYGSGVTQGRVKLYYYRHVISALKRSDYPDFLDEYISVLIDEVKRNVTEYKNGKS